MTVLKIYAMTATQEKIMTVEEYIQFELKSERRHEYINGQLFEMPGEKAINNRKAGRIYQFLIKFLLGYEIYWNDIKIAIPGENKFYYPDLFATKEFETEANEYIKYEPELIVEVLSKSTRSNDLSNKYIDYAKIPSLKYYMVVEPATTYLILYSKDEQGQWEAESYSKTDEVILMPLLQLELPMKLIYS